MSSIPSLAGATGWLNSHPLTPHQLMGKVVMVNFWTYTCINWLRTLPYVRAWHQKYHEFGLVVIGVHTPEFPFEHDGDNVRQAAKAMGVTWPIAIDNDHTIWSAFGNHFWPALYFADTTGHVRHHSVGEGDYDLSEEIIQRLLNEAGSNGFEFASVSPEPSGVEEAADWEDLESSETYLGFQRGANFASPGGVVPDKHHRYDIPEAIRPDHWALSGEWTIGEGAATLTHAPGRIAFQFHARDLNLVMGPIAQGKSVPFRVRLDGKPVGQAHGVDSDVTGHGTLADQRLYQLVRQARPIADRQFEIEFPDSGLEALAFTFG